MAKVNLDYPQGIVRIQTSNLHMEHPSHYWQMRVLTPSGKLGFKDFPKAQQFFKASFADNDIEDLSNRTCQDELWHLCHPDPENTPIAQLCLRCWISHRIVFTCNQLARDFGEKYSFRAEDLWPLVLHDDGKVPATYRSLAIEILDSYNPERGALGNWTSRLTKNHSEINRFLLGLGLYRPTPWSILNDTKPEQLARFLPHLSQSELKIAQQRLKAHHRVYRTERIAKRTSRGQRCAIPTDEQIQRMDPGQPPNVVLAQLQDLAEQLRESRVAARGGALPSQSLDAKEYNTEPVAPTSDDAEETQTEFLKKYRQDFLNTLGEAIQKIVAGYTDFYQRRNPPQGNAYREALQLFHCKGLSMGQIAKVLELTNQVKVTRLLKLRDFRAKVCIYWLEKLKAQVRTDALEHLSVNEFDAIADQLEQILTEETQTVMNEAASEAQIPKNRTTSSVFARRICAVVPDLPPIT